MSGSARCRYCGRPVVWATTPGGANLPVDPEPSQHGLFVLEATGIQDGRVQFSTRQCRPSDAAGKRYTCHIDTCPDRP